MFPSGIHHVTIIGVGLLGGSAGLAIKALGGGVQVAGVGRRAESLREAMRVGAIDSVHLDAAETVGKSELVILATPVCSFERYLKAIAPHLKKGAIVTDVGSTKGQVVRAASKILGAKGVFVGSHPMAGSDRRGPQHATANLFRGAKCIVTPTAKTPAAAMRKVEQFWRALGMGVVKMSPTQHDRAVAEISHLPHALSCLLMRLPAEENLNVAANGFRDMTRIAGSDVEMWRDIFLTNPKAILAVTAKFRRSLGQLEKLISAGDAAAIEKFLHAAKSRREDFISGK